MLYPWAVDGGGGGGAAWLGIDWMGGGTCCHGMPIDWGGGGGACQPGCETGGGGGTPGIKPNKSYYCCIYFFYWRIKKVFSFPIFNFTISLFNRQ